MDGAQEKSNDLSFRDLWASLTTGEMLFFLFEVTVMGAGMGVVERLLFIYLTGDLQGSTFLCGLTVGVTTSISGAPCAW